MFTIIISRVKIIVDTIFINIISCITQVIVYFSQEDRAHVQDKLFLGLGSYRKT